MRCVRCRRPLLHPVWWQGNAYGETCAEAVGAPTGKRRKPVVNEKRDDLTLEMFPDHLEVAGRVHSILGGISLEMTR